ncbi:MAG: DMT family transporter [Candidatus Hodarchaeales archaeon]
MEFQFSKDYILALIQALFVTVLWSSSWVIIKFGLEDLPPLFFAGFRYLIGSFILVILVFIDPSHRNTLKNKDSRMWIMLFIYGVVFITFTQGGQFLALSLLPAITVSFLLNLTPFAVLLFSFLLLHEDASLFELLFFLVALLGILFYFFPFSFEAVSTQGLLVGLGLVIVNALSSIIGRSINRGNSLHPIVITAISMTFGSILLITFAIGFERIPSISLTSFLLILWLGVVNTALAFTLWNSAMRNLRAMDISIINGTMFPQIVFLSIIFLEELPLINEWIGLIILLVATFVLQFNRARTSGKDNSTTKTSESAS